MTLQKKLAVLADAAKCDASCASSGAKKTRPGPGLDSTHQENNDAFFIAWYQPDHFIIREVAPFFKKLFAVIN